MKTDQNASTVLFDGSCPICTAEINQYKQIAPTGRINWVDVSSDDFIPPLGKSKEALLQRFHVIKPDGDLVSGAAAFVHVWEQLPGWRRLAAITKIPGALSVMELGYTTFLKIRPQVQSLFKKDSLKFLTPARFSGFLIEGKAMSKIFQNNRRIFLMQVAVIGSALNVVTKADAQIMLAEADPQATALGYKADASKVDKTKQPKYAAGQICGNCALFQATAGAAAGGCPLFAGKQVAAQGWCSAYAKKA